MRSVIVRGFLTRKLRSALTAIAILLGVAMISGTFVLTDKINTAFADIFENGNANVDVVVRSRRRFTSDDSTADSCPSSPSVADGIAGVARRRHGRGAIETQGFLVRGDEKLKPPTDGAPSFVFTATPPEPSARSRSSRARCRRASGQVAILEDQADDENIDVGDRCS